MGNMKPSGTGPDENVHRQFEQLLEPLIPTLYRQAYRWTAARDRAEDLVQELLIKLYPRMDELAELDQVQPWVLRVMYRIFVDQHRRNTAAPVRPLHELHAGDGESHANAEDNFASEEAGPEEATELDLTAQRLSAAWSRLGEDQRVLIAMHDIEGYRLEELAEMLGVPVGTLKSRLHRGRARMRQLLAMEPFAAQVRVREHGE